VGQASGDTVWMGARALGRRTASSEKSSRTNPPTGNFSGKGDGETTRGIFELIELSTSRWSTREELNHPKPHDLNKEKQRTRRGYYRGGGFVGPSLNNAEETATVTRQGSGGTRKEGEIKKLQLVRLPSPVHSVEGFESRIRVNSGGLERQEGQNGKRGRKWKVRTTRQKALFRNHRTGEKTPRTA